MISSENIKLRKGKIMIFVSNNSNDATFGE